MKPIIFGVDNVFNAFKERGSIATFRTTYPTETEFWIRRTRTGSKEFDARLIEVERVEKGEELKFAKHFHEQPTGFQSIREWIQKVEEIHGQIPAGWILHLEKRRDTQ